MKRCYHKTLQGDRCLRSCSGKNKTCWQHQKGGRRKKKTIGWVTNHVRSISKEHLEEIFQLFLDTYKSADQEIWLTKVDDLIKRYNCLTTMYVDNKRIKCFYLIRLLPYANQISLIGHDGTNKGKQLLFDRISHLVLLPGYTIEVSDKPDWILRSKYGLHPIQDKEIILKLLKKTDDKIKMLPNYDINDKHSYVYERRGQKKSLYGRSCPPHKATFMEYKWKGHGCDRKCRFVE